MDLGLNDVDPGLAPEGARCDEDSLCVNRKCIPVASLVIGPNSCPKNCNGHGMCNSEGNCHCDIGYAPPFCDSPGAGGSIDSGPASEGQTSNWLILLYVLLMMVPMFVIFWVLCQKMPRRSDWRLLVEKAKPRKRLSEVDPASAAAVAEATPSFKIPRVLPCWLPGRPSALTILSHVCRWEPVCPKSPRIAKDAPTGTEPTHVRSN